MSLDAPLVVDTSLISALRADLCAASYTVENITQLLGPVADRAMHREQPVAALYYSESSQEPALVLFRFFTLGIATERRILEPVFGQLGVDGLVRLGLVVCDDEQPSARVRPLVDMRPYSAVDDLGAVQWWLVSDLGELATEKPLKPHHVLGTGGASLTLAAITIREQVARSLDIGTGCGIQALHLARHSSEVVATDISLRALNIASFNAELNEVANIEFRHGSMLEPVYAERFDLVVTNPPFVITPRASSAIGDYEYRDAKRAGDALVAELVGSIGQVLNPGGYAQMLVNWEHHDDESWQDRISSWLADSDLDAWFVQRDLLDPAQYAELWLRDGGLSAHRDPARWVAGYRDYLADFAGRNVTAVGMGMALIHRNGQNTDGVRAPWRRFEEYEGSLAMPLGPALSSSLRALNRLADTSDTELMAMTVTVSPDVTEERYYRPGQADPAVVMLRQGGGFCRSVHASSAVAGVVGACDGELTLGQLIGAVATLTQRPVDEVQHEVLPAVRGLIVDGFLTM